MKIRTNDEVVVLAGSDRGKRGRVLRVITKHNRVIVEGVNMVTRHLKRNPQNPQAGGRVERAAPLDVSNVALWSDAESRGVKVRVQGEGRAKVRISARTGQPIVAGAKGGKGAKAAKKPAKKNA